jgi:cysteine-rich repeat protein
MRELLKRSANDLLRRGYHVILRSFYEGNFSANQLGAIAWNENTWLLELPHHLTHGAGGFEQLECLYENGNPALVPTGGWYTFKRYYDPRISDGTQLLRFGVSDDKAYLPGDGVIDASNLNGLLACNLKFVEADRWTPEMRDATHWTWLPGQVPNTGSPAAYQGSTKRWLARSPDERHPFLCRSRLADAGGVRDWKISTDAGIWSEGPSECAKLGSGSYYFDVPRTFYENASLTGAYPKQTDVVWLNYRWQQPVDPVCGNGALEPGEECDDGNMALNDGCTDKCRVEQYTPPEVRIGAGPLRCGGDLGSRVQPPDSRGRVQRSRVAPCHSDDSLLYDGDSVAIGAFATEAPIQTLFSCSGPIGSCDDPATFDSMDDLTTDSGKVRYLTLHSAGVTEWEVAAYGRDIRDIDSPVVRATFTVYGDRVLADEVCRVAEGLCEIRAAEARAPQWRPYQGGDPPRFVSKIAINVALGVTSTAAGEVRVAAREFAAAARKLEVFQRQAAAAGQEGLIAADVTSELLNVGDGLRTTLLELAGPATPPSSTTTTIPSSIPDLLIASVDTLVGTETDCVLAYTLRNGGRAVAEASTTRVDVSAADQPTSTFAVSSGALEAGDSRQETVVLSGVSCETIDTVVTANATGVVVESDEDNNTKRAHCDLSSQTCCSGTPCGSTTTTTFTTITTTTNPPQCSLNCLPSNCVCPPGQGCSPEFGCIPIPPQCDLNCLPTNCICPAGRGCSPEFGCN